MTDELERLTKLRDSGALSDDEFAQSKAALLAGQSQPAAAATTPVPPPEKTSPFAIKSPIVIIGLLIILVPVSINVFGYLLGRGPTGIPSVIGPEVLADKELTIPDGDGITYTLEKGSYRIEVDANAGANHGVTISWKGAGCPAQAERQRHDVKCDVTTGGTKVIITNPSLLGMGSAAKGQQLLDFAPYGSLGIAWGPWPYLNILIGPYVYAVNTAPRRHGVGMLIAVGGNTDIFSKLIMK